MRTRDCTNDLSFRFSHLKMSNSQFSFVICSGFLKFFFAFSCVNGRTAFVKLNRKAVKRRSVFAFLIMEDPEETEASSQTSNI